MEEVWVEKWRPKTLADVIGHRTIIPRLQAYVKKGTLPHLILAGPAGTGKTSSALALAREFYGDDWRLNFHELNASDERGIDVVRKRIKDFARTAPFGSADFKIIFLDEADALTPEAQAALRRTMEKYSRSTRFVLSCNYSSKLIDPIQSRCVVFRFTRLQDEDIITQVKKIAKAEKVKLAKGAAEAIASIVEGDVRRAVNILQVAAVHGEEVTEEEIFQTANAARPQEVEKLLMLAIEGRFLDARDHLDELFINYGLAGSDIVRQIHRAIYSLPLSERDKVMLIDRTGEIEFRISEGADERIQLETLLASFRLAGLKPESEEE